MLRKTPFLYGGVYEGLMAQKYTEDSKGEKVERWSMGVLFCCNAIKRKEGLWSVFDGVIY